MKELHQIRQHLHQHPELSGKEVATQKFIRQELELLDASELIDVGKTGLLITFDSGNPGPALLLRADIDALPIRETNTFSYRSEQEGISHKCGHDGHTTVMIGVARHFSQHPPKKGKLSLLFQPAEETGEGAAAVLADPVMQERKYDQAYAFHNLPGFPEGSVVCKPGTFSAGAISVAFSLIGKTSHAAEPERGCNPAPAVADILHCAEKLSQPDSRRDDFALITPVYLHMGERAYGTSPGAAEAHFTLRTWGNDDLHRLEDQLKTDVAAICRERKLRHEVDDFEEFRPNVNTQSGYAVVKKAAESAQLPFREIKEPFRWGEDFGLFTQTLPGAMFGIGSGEKTPSLHSDDFDFPDAIIAPAMQVFINIANEILE